MPSENLHLPRLSDRSPEPGGRSKYPFFRVVSDCEIECALLNTYSRDHSRQLLEGNRLLGNQLLSSPHRTTNTWFFVWADYSGFSDFQLLQSQASWTPTSG